MEAAEESSDSDTSDDGSPGANVHAVLSASLAPPGDESDEEEADAPPLVATVHTAANAEESKLPSALDVLDPSLEPPTFLHVAGPEFDASKGFRPPPVTAADMGPASNVERKPRHLGESQAFHEAYPHNSDYPCPSGSGRLHGSVCLETDDERGRRVRYGAHAMLKADPWSACNPNYSMSDNSVTRGHDRRPTTGKRKVGE